MTGSSARLRALLSGLGVDRANFAAAAPFDVATIAGLDPASVASLTIVGTDTIDPVSFRGHVGPITLIGTDREPHASRLDAAAAAIPRARRRVLPGYDWFLWSDVAACHGDVILQAVLDGAAAAGSASRSDSEVREQIGEIAGLRYRVAGSGPFLVLLPLALAPSQWTPILGRLSSSFTVVLIGGPHVGMTSTLEDRARSPSYRRLLEQFIDLLHVNRGDSVLEVGCGTAAPSRILARRTAAARIVAADISAFLLDEARLLAETEGVGSRIDVVEGSAEALPFADASFDVAFSVTVLEECQAEAALRELVRVVRPGGRVGAVVRAQDIAPVVNVDVSAELRAAFCGLTGAGCVQGGCADVSLYRRMAALGLRVLDGMPQFASVSGLQSVRLSRASLAILSELSDPLKAEYKRAEAEAMKRGDLFIAHAYHRCVGVKTGKPLGTSVRRRLEAMPWAP